MVNAAAKEPDLLLIPPVQYLATPMSFAGYLSGHWTPQVVALEHAGGPEIATNARQAAWREIKAPTGDYELLGSWGTAP
jgi:hypothetical protein